MSDGWHDIIGTLGVALVLICYLWLQTGRLRAEQLSYSVANGLGALLILVSLAVDFNLSAFLMEAAWLVISLYGILRWLRRPAR